MAAGVIGSYAQTLFFRATRRFAPQNPPDVFEKPEQEQAGETATQTVARRVVEAMAQRGPIKHKQAAAEAVHYTFGGAWGGLYGLAAASYPALRSLRGSIAFGLGVWLVSDNLILPSFRLAAWPGAYPVNSHVYAMAAHAVYGGAAFASILALEKLAAPRAIAVLGSYWLARRTWGPLRPTVRRLAKPAIQYSLLARDVTRALA